MRLVILESPYAGDITENEKYARECLHDMLTRYDEAPIASHLLYTQPGVLLDYDKIERKLGIAAGHAWLKVAEAVIVYHDKGISKGMRYGIAQAKKYNIPVEYRQLMTTTVPGFSIPPTE